MERPSSARQLPVVRFARPYPIRSARRRRSYSSPIPNRLRPTVAATAPRRWLGRSVEREVLERLLDEVREGSSRALALRGEPGIGKTALLELAIDLACGFRVFRVGGVQSEMELAFAGLHQL